MVPVNGGVDVFEPGESQDHVFIPQGDDMEGDLLGNTFDVEEEGGGEVDYSFAVNGVVGVPCVDGLL